jgi:lysyl-tRNA synthetase class II
MRQHLRALLSAVTLVIMCSASLSSAAVAEHGVPPAPNAVSSSSSTSTNDSNSEDQTAAGSTEQETQINDRAKTFMQQFKQEGQADVQSQSKVKMHTQQMRQKSCEARKASLTKRMTNSVAAATRHKQVFDNIYTKVQTFYTTKNLNVANYADLKAKVDAAQADAAAKIDALKSLDITVDCTQTDSLASNLSAFKTAVGSTRDSIKAYRTSLVALITAIHGASTSTDKNSNSSTTNDTQSAQ